MKSGFVGLIGRPNVGKSTLLNAILEAKLAIVSSKPQTTRNSIRGIYNDEESQIIFVDTPGIHKPKHELGSYMNKVATTTLLEMDVVVFIVDASEEFGAGDTFILNLIKEAEIPVILVLNKIDKVNNEQLILKVNECKDLYQFNDIIPISALDERNIDKFLQVVKTYLLPDIQYYSENTVTDITDTFYYREIIREKILFHTQEEIPHSVAVVIEDIIEDDGESELYAAIIVERNSQKGIIVGKGGSMIKQIGSEARAEIQKYKGRKVHLSLVVKVDKNWRRNARSLTKYGYEY